MKDLIALFFIVVFISFGFLYTGFRYYLERTAKHASLLIHYSEFQKAISLTEPVFKRFRWNGEIGHAYGRALMGIQKYREAAEVLEEASRYKFNYMLNFHLGYCYEQLGLWDKALEQYTFIVDYSTNEKNAIRGVIRVEGKKILQKIYSMKGQINIDELKQLNIELDNVIRSDIDDPFANEAKMEMLYLFEDDIGLNKIKKSTSHQNQADNWINLLNFSKSLENGEWDAAFEKGQILLDSHDVSPSIYLNMYYKLQQFIPQNPTILSRHQILLAQILIKGGNMNQAIDVLKKAIQIDNSNKAAEKILNELTTETPDNKQT